MNLMKKSSSIALMLVFTLLASIVVPTSAGTAQAAEPSACSQQDVDCNMAAKFQNSVVVFIGNKQIYKNGDWLTIDESKTPVRKARLLLAPTGFFSDVLAASVTASAENETVTVNGVAKEMKGQVLMDNGNVLVPLEEVAALVGKKLYVDIRGLIVISDTDNVLTRGIDQPFVDQVIDRMTPNVSSIVSTLPFVSAASISSAKLTPGKSASIDLYVDKDDGATRAGFTIGNQTIEISSKYNGSSDIPKNNGNTYKQEKGLFYLKDGKGIDWDLTRTDAMDVMNKATLLVSRGSGVNANKISWIVKGGGLLGAGEYTAADLVSDVSIVKLHTKNVDYAVNFRLGELTAIPKMHSAMLLPWITHIDNEEFLKDYATVNKSRGLDEWAKFKENIAVLSAEGKVTQQEILALKAYIDSLPKPSNNVNNALLDFGEMYEAILLMGTMYDITKDEYFLNKRLEFTDRVLYLRNDPKTGVKMVTGQREATWEHHNNSWYKDGEFVVSSDIAHASPAFLLADLALTIVKDPALQNKVVGFDPFGYGITYLDRAKTFVKAAEETFSTYVLKYYLNNQYKKDGAFDKTERIARENMFVWPDSRLGETLTNVQELAQQGNYYMWNRQQMTLGAMARTVDVLRKLNQDIVLADRYDQVIKAQIDLFYEKAVSLTVTDESGQPKDALVWGYSIYDSAEDYNHGAVGNHGMYSLYESGRYGVTKERLERAQNLFAYSMFQGTQVDDYRWSYYINGSANNGNNTNKLNNYVEDLEPLGYYLQLSALNNNFFKKIINNARTPRHPFAAAQLLKYRSDTFGIEKPIPLLQSIKLDGVPLSGFSPQKLEYKVPIELPTPLEDVVLPKVEASGNGTVVVKPAASQAEATIIELSNPAYNTKAVYKINFVISSKTGTPRGTKLPIASAQASFTDYKTNVVNNVVKNTYDGDMGTSFQTVGYRWITYDLGSVQAVGGVAVARPLGNQRVEYTLLEASENGTSWKRIFYGQNSAMSTALESYPISEVNARYIRISAWGNSGTNNGEWQKSTISEVEIYAPPIPEFVNVALNKIATQSSTSNSGIAGRAVDGNNSGVFTNGSVTHTVYEPGAWWQVDLGKSEYIGKINVWNRTDCCGERLSNYYVLVSDQPFTSNALEATRQQPGVSSYYQANNAGSPTKVSVGKTGRYVRVQLVGGGPLSLAEVEVMADKTAPVTTDDVKDTWKTTEQTVNLFASDYGSGVGKTFYSLDGGAFVEGTMITITGLGLHTIKYYSVDRAGNIEAVKSVEVKVESVNDMDPTVQYDTNWTYSNNRNLGDFRNDTHYTKVDGAAVGYAFWGTGIEYITETNADQGDVDVYIDGSLVKTVSTNSATRKVMQTVFSKLDLALGYHNIVLVKRSGTYMVVDSFKPYSNSNNVTILNDNNTTIKYGSGWGYAQNRSLGEYQGDVHYATVIGSTVELTFTGTGIEYITSKNIDQGEVEVTVDNESSVMIDTYNASRLVQQAVFSRKNLSMGTHKIKLTMKSGKYMLVDAFKVYVEPTELSNKPYTVITSYVDGQQIPENKLQFKWFFGDPLASASRVQKAYQVQGSMDNWSTIAFDTEEVVSSATSYTTSELQDSKNWSFRVRTKNSSDVWSEWANRKHAIDTLNVARNKSAIQSSTSNEGVASRAVDGNTNGDFSGKSVTHTDPSKIDPWWQVDLGANVYIDKINVWNRTLCCADRLKNYDVLVSDKAFDTTMTLEQVKNQQGVSVYHQQDIAGTPTTVSIGRTGQYVRIQRPGPDVLSLAEVEVYQVKDVPTATVSYSATTETDKDVVATITPSKPVTITNNDGLPSYTFTENGTFKFEFVDSAGIRGAVTATVTNILKPPTATVAYSLTTATNQDVVATITPSKPGVTITNNGGLSSYTFYFNGSFTFEFVDALGNRGTATATVNNITSNSTAKPGAIALSHNNGWDTGLQDGDYDVITDIWSGNNGKIYKLYENGALIDTKILTENSPTAQHVVTSITNKPNGTYKYVVELTNAFGTTRSNELSVVVTQASPGTPKLSDTVGWMNGLRDGFYTVKMNMDWGVNGNQYKLYENGVLIDTQTLTAHTPSAQSTVTTVTYKPNGTYKYVAELSNALGLAKSNELTVTVTQAAPAKPVLSSDNTSGGGSFNVTMNMWSGTDGQTYNLYENGVLIYTQPLGFKTPAAQSAVAVIANRSRGTYQYRGELVNFAGTTSSDIMTVNVTK